ncbi:MAG: hypothetical protein WCF84_22580 [Anaerolineae bacterium]
MNQYRDRIIEIRVMKARELQDNDGNWRIHPAAQTEAVGGILKEIGKGDVLRAYFSPRSNGQLVLLDGHLRKSLNPDEEWRVAILDLTDEEADKYILFFDPLAAMAEMNGPKVLALIEHTVTDDLALRDLMRRMAVESAGIDEEEQEDGDDAKTKPELPGMDIQPFEHYDYLVLFFKTTFDFEAALDFFGVHKAGWYAHMSGNYSKGRMKIGLGRALDGGQAMTRIQKLTRRDDHADEPAHRNPLP